MFARTGAGSTGNPTNTKSKPQGPPGGTPHPATQYLQDVVSHMAAQHAASVVHHLANVHAHGHAGYQRVGDHTYEPTIANFVHHQAQPISPMSSALGKAIHAAMQNPANYQQFQPGPGDVMTQQGWAIAPQAGNDLAAQLAQITQQSQGAPQAYNGNNSIATSGGNGILAYLQSLGGR